METKKALESIRSVGMKHCQETKSVSTSVTWVDKEGRNHFADMYDVCKADVFDHGGLGEAQLYIQNNDSWDGGPSNWLRVEVFYSAYPHKTIMTVQCRKVKIDGGLGVTYGG